MQTSEISPLLIESFIRDSKKTVELLGGLLESPDFKKNDNLQQFRITVHGIKSSLRNIGEAGLAETASLLEDASRNEDAGFIEANAPAFLDALRAVLSKLQAALDSAGGMEGDDPPDIKDKLLEIKEMCEDYNRRGALKLIAEITTCTAETRAVLDTIKEHVSQSDFEDAESAAEAYADTIDQSLRA